MAGREHTDKYKHLAPQPDRRCRRADGVPKWRFISRDQAEAEAQRWEGYEVYECKVCGLWHLGHRREEQPA